MRRCPRGHRRSLTSCRKKAPELCTVIPAKIERPKVQEKADDFLQAAQAILKQEPNAQASADKPTGHIPLPKKRPLPR
jgi:hypothetical protein